MVLAIGPKRDPLPIRRPARRVALAAQILELLRFLFAIERRDPKVFLPGPNDILSVGRNLEIFAALFAATNVTEQARLTAAHIDRPRLLFWHFRQAARICRRPFLVQLRAARVDDRFPVGRQPHARDLLTFIALIGCDLPRHEIGCICDPDVALPFLVENPGHARRMRRSREAGWKGRA
jgi:hypothetical protein